MQVAKCLDTIKYCGEQLEALLHPKQTLSLLPFKQHFTPEIAITQ